MRYRGRYIQKKELPNQTDVEIKKKMNAVLLRDLSTSEIPMLTQMDQLCLALLIENYSEFLLGVIEEETNFKEDWEVNRMDRQRKSWGGIDKETAKLWLDETKGLLCARFPYKEKVIDEIRQKIPKGKKSWNPDDKIWEFSIETIEVVVEILSNNFENLIDLTQAAPPALTSSNGTDPLLSLLDADDINKIHKMLSRKYHPDVGGDGEKMARINQIFSKVK